MARTITVNHTSISHDKTMHICFTMTRWFCDGFIMHHFQNLSPLPCCCLLREVNECLQYIPVVHIFVEQIMIELVTSPVEAKQMYW